MARHKLKEQKLVPQATAQALELSLPSQAPLERLARSLDEFGSNVAGIAVRKANESATAETQRGSIAGAEAVAAGLDTEEELLDAKIITRGEGSFFRDGVMLMAGQAHADAFAAALTVAAAEKSLHTSVDPDAMDRLVEELAGQFNSGDRGEAFAAGFAERAASLVSQAKQRHANTVAGNLEKLNNEQLTDLLRGGLLEAVDGVDGEFLVENSRAAIFRIHTQWLGNIRDIHPRDRRLLNLATVRAIESLIDDGILNDARAVELMKSIPTSDGNNLWGKKLHSDIIRDAVDRSLTRQSKRLKAEEDSKLRIQLAAQVDYTERMFARGLEDGFLDTTEMRVAQELSKGQLFTVHFIRDQELRSIEWEKAAQDTYIGNVAMFRDYGVRIISGEGMNTEEMSVHIKRGGLTLEQGLRLAQLQATHKDMKLNNPIETAMFNKLDSMTKGGLGSWAGAQFATQAYSAGASTMAEMWQEWKKDPKNAGMSVQDPRFLEFVNETVTFLQREFMLPSQWRLLQESQADNERDNKIEPYVDTLFEPDPATLKLYYAETLMMREGRRPSSGLSALLSEPGRAIPADAPVESYTQAILAQMKLAGIDIKDNDIVAEIDSIIKGLRPQAEEGAEETEKPAEETSTAEDSTDKFSALRAQRQAENKAALELITKTATAVGGAVGGAIVTFANAMASTRTIRPEEMPKNLTVQQILELKASLLAGGEEEEQLGVALTN